MKKLYLFLMAVMLTTVASYASKAYFDNSTANWSKVNAYYWDGGVTGPKWPGEAMTLDPATGLYEIEIDGTPGWIIFNNGDAQTANLPFVDGGKYNESGLLEGEVKVIEMNVTYDNSTTNWANVYAYTYGGDGDKVCGNWPGTLMTKGANNMFTLKLEVYGLPGNIIFSDGTGGSHQTDNLDFENNATYNFVGIVDTDPGTEPSGYKDLYLVGANFGGWKADKAYKLTREDNVYTIELAEGLSGEWKLFDGTWDYTFGAGADQPALDTDTEVWFNSPVNFTLATTGKTKVTFTLVEGSDELESSIASILRVEAEGGDTPEPPTPPTPGEYKDLYLVGENLGGWKVDEAYKLTREENVYTIELAEGISGEWKIFDGTWDYTFGAGADQPALDTDTEVWFNSPVNFTLATTGKTKVTFTLVEGSDELDSSIASILCVEAEGGDTPEPPVTGDYKDLYLVGAMTEWALNEDYKFERKDNVYTLITGPLSGEWKIWDGTWDYNFGCGATQAANETCEAWFDGGNFTIATNNDTTITFTLVEGSDEKDSSIPSTIVVAYQDSVESVIAAGGISVADGTINVAEGQEICIFNTAGALISRSAHTAVAPGLYIVVVDGHAAKVLVK